MKRLAMLVCLVAALVFSACGGNDRTDHKFAGSFTDEFGNKFVLNDDYTGTLQFDKTDKVQTIKWYDGEDHKRPYATIEWNGDPTYYYLRDGALYRTQDEMNQGRCAVKIEYDD